MDDFREQVRKSFKKCKLDIEEVTDKNLKLQEYNSEILKENDVLKNQIKNLTDELLGFKTQMTTLTTSIENITTSNQQFQQNMLNMQEMLKTQQITINNLNIQQNQQKQDEKQKQVSQKKSKKLNAQKEDPYEALLSFKAKANKKDVLKQKILSMVGDGITQTELKFLFVEHYRYCSKATFYNYLKEVELQNEIVIKRESSKNMIYLNANVIRNEIEL